MSAIESAKLFLSGLGGSIRTLILLGLLAAVQPASPQVGGPDPRMGLWTLTTADSSLDPPNRLSITHLHEGVHVVMSGESHFDFTANRNGHDSSAPGNLGFNQIELHRMDKRQAEVRQKKDGTLVATVREKLSKDGNELTTTTTTAGKPDRITVWTRTGSTRWLNELGIQVPPQLTERAKQLETAGNTVSWLMQRAPLAPTALALIAFGDTVKPTARVLSNGSPRWASKACSLPATTAAAQRSRRPGARHRRHSTRKCCPTTKPA